MHRRLSYHALTLEHLARAVRHVELSETLIVAQRARVERARSLCLDVTERATTLALFEDIRRLYVAHRDQLRAQVQALDGMPTPARKNAR